MSEPNMEFAGKSRKRIKVGDVFAMKYPDVGYIFGRVAVREWLAGDPLYQVPDGASLQYFFDFRSDKPVARPEDLRMDRLLIPPVFSNFLGWRRGYYLTVGNWPLSEEEDPSLLIFHEEFKDMYYRRDGSEVANPGYTCGVLGLVSYLWIDDRLSDALGIPRAPE